jgi:hypothetical protein
MRSGMDPNRHAGRQINMYGKRWSSKLLSQSPYQAKLLLSLSLSS